MTKTHTWDGELTNTCSCRTYDPITEEETMPSSCYGDCWDDTLHLFSIGIEDWFNNNPTYEWSVSGLPLWNGTASGNFTAKTIAEFIRGITVNAEWSLRYKVEGSELHCNLSHHDAPTGGSYTVTYGAENE
jgi:hypothetical protein